MQPNNLKAIHRIEAVSRSYDPIETVSPEFDDTELAEEALSDAARIDTILQEDRFLTAQERHDLYEMGCNARLEWLYAKHGGGSLPLSEFSTRIDEAETFFKEAGRHAMQSHDRDPRKLWTIMQKHQDLRALQAYRNAREAQSTLHGTEAGHHAWQLAENQVKGVLLASVAQMRDMSRFADGRSELAQDTRGSLYEMMLITYARLKTYEDEVFDSVFVRSALDREDRPWNGHVYPKRAFDIVIESGGEKRLLQAKNHRNNDEYADPIEKIEDHHYARTQADLDKFIEDFKLIIANPPDPNLRQHIIRAQERLDQVFGQQLAASLSVNS